MRFGLCCGLDRAAEAIAAGFDYVELSASEMAMADPWDPCRYDGITVEATNLFFPGSVRLIGPNATPYEDPARRAIERAASLGVKVMVVGSGGSRRAPDGFPQEAAEDRFADVAAELQQIAAQHGVTIAPEPLCREETNVGNDVGRLAERLAARGVGFTLDSFHVIRVAELLAYDESGALSGWRDEVRRCPAHVHLANRERLVPESSDPMMRGLVLRLRELGYDGRCSLECSGFDVARDSARALDELHTLFG